MSEVILKKDRSSTCGVIFPSYLDCPIVFRLSDAKGIHQLYLFLPALSFLTIAEMKIKPICTMFFGYKSLFTYCLTDLLSIVNNDAPSCQRSYAFCSKDLQPLNNNAKRSQLQLEAGRGELEEEGKHAAGKVPSRLRRER